MELPIFIRKQNATERHWQLLIAAFERFVHYSEEERVDTTLHIVFYFLIS